MGKSRSKGEGQEFRDPACDGWGSKLTSCDPRRTTATLSLSGMVGRGLFVRLFLIICLAVAVDDRRTRS